MKPVKAYSGFIGERIRNLRTAIFYDFSPSLIKWPTMVINILNADDSGKIWFFIRAPFGDTSGLSESFYGEMNFFNKVCDYYVKAGGIVHIVKSEIRMREYTENKTDGREVLLLCMSVQHVRLFQSRKRPKEIFKLSGFLADFLFHNRVRQPQPSISV